MSYSENLRYAERARDLAWDRLCDEEDKAISEYKESCEFLENEFKKFKEFKAKYESQLRYISLEDLHDYIVYRYEKKILILNRSKALY